MADQNTQPAQPVQQAAAPEQAQPQPSEAPKQLADSDERFFAAVGYFAFLFVVPLIVKPKSAYCKFHAKQSMVLFVISIIVLMVLASIPMIGSLLTLALFALYVLAIFRAYKGDLWNIPFVSNFAGKIDLNAMYNKAGLAVSNVSGIAEKAQSAVQKAGEAAKSLGDQEKAKKPAEEEQKK